MRIPLLQRALNLFPLPRSTMRGSRGRVIGGRHAVDEYEARLTSGVFAVAAYLARGFRHAEFVAERLVGKEWQRDVLPEFEMLREHPNPVNSLGEMLVSAAVDTAAHGTGYVEMVRAPNGLVGAVWWCPTALTSVEYESGGTDVRVYRAGGRPNRGTRQIEPGDMLRVQRGISLSSPAEGMSPLEVLGDAVGADRQLMRTLNAALHNAAKAALVMPVNDGGSWGQDEVDAMAETLRAQSSLDNYGRAGAAPHRFEVANVGREHRAGPFAEAQMLAESRIAAAFGVPTQLVSLYTGRLNRAAADLEAARKVAFENVLAPIGTEVADALTRHLLPGLGVGSEWRIGVDWSGHPVAAAEQQAHVEMMLKLQAAGVVNARQVAEAAGVEYAGGEE